MKTITITEKQRQQFNLMRMALIQIHKDYQTPNQLRRECKSEYGLDFEETIEMAYENIQLLAKGIVKGVKQINVVLLLLVSMVAFTSCTHRSTDPNPSLQIGQTYHIRGNVFNTGAYQPQQPVLVTRLYVDYLGRSFADCKARVDWNKLNAPGTAEQIRKANEHYENVGDTSTVVWNVPQGDLVR